MELYIRNPENSFKYLIGNGKGVSSAAMYSYTSGENGEVGICNDAAQIPSKVKVTGFEKLAPGESNLLSAVFNQGPVAVGMSCEHWSFFSYTAGIYYEPECTNSTNLIDHYMVVIGYGTSATGEDFWIIKNRLLANIKLAGLNNKLYHYSWGTSWGISGFIKVARNVNNMCCVACRGSITTIDPILCL